MRNIRSKSLRVHFQHSLPGYLPTHQTVFHVDSLLKYIAFVLRLSHRVRADGCSKESGVHLSYNGEGICFLLF